MAADPILAAHAVGDKCFEVGGEFSPASIRDQMVRSYLVVDRAFQEGIIDTAGRDLLVVGAGPSGLTAAVRAAELGVKVVVVERRPRHAFLLGRCTSRDVEPTLYDWPSNHWTLNVFGWTGAHMELGWRSGRANLIALDWQRRLAAVLRRYAPLIDLRYGTRPVLPALRATPKVNGAGMLDVGLARSGGPATRQVFGGLVSCIGFGRERCELGSYRGFSFWETEDFEDPNCGLTFQPKILISGGGDGALQDFNRVMTLRSTKKAFEKVIQALAGTPGLLEQVEKDLQDAEDVARRALSWNMDSHDGPVLRRLEAAHVTAIDGLAASPAWTSIVRAVQSMLPKPLPDVLLVHPKPWFGPCYPINRFLALLILKVVTVDVGLRRPNTHVTSVKGALHTCARNARACHGQPHDVAFMTDKTASTGIFDVVILRHGIIGPRHLFRGAPPARLRHILPFYVDP